jgi:hypothetical protein
MIPYLGIWMIILGMLKNEINGLYQVYFYLEKP